MVRILTLTLNPALDVSACTERVQPTSKLRCDSVERHPGGGGINVARVLARLGADVVAWYTSGGTSGQLLTELLAAEGVACHPLPIDGHTRESFTVLDSGTREEYRFVLPGPELLASQCDGIVEAVVAALKEALPQEGAVSPPWLVASGSLPPGAPVDFYGNLARRLRSEGVCLVVDTSGPALKGAMEQGVWLAKPSLREFREFVGRPLDTWDALARAASDARQQCKVRTLVVSCGEQGALMVDAQGMLFAPALPITVTSAVGAGDSFVAGMVWSMANGKSRSDAFALGVACGSAALASSGTALCHPADVQRLLPQVQLAESLPKGRI